MNVPRFESRNANWSLVGMVGALLLCAGGEVRANTCWCDWTFIRSAPAATALLPLNPRILLNNCGFAELARYRPYLTGGGHSVKLKEVDAFSAGLSGATVFMPEEKLRPRTRYELRFRRLPKKVTFDAVAWTTGDFEDSTPPAWQSLPAIDESRSRSDGGSGWMAALELPVAQGEGATWVTVEVMNDSAPLLERTSAKLHLFYLEAGEWSGIELAQAPCGDYLGLEPGSSYTLWVQLVDLAGHKSEHRAVRLRIPVGPSPIFEVHTVIFVDSVFRKVEPVYPALPRQARITGTVEGEVSVDAAGTVVSVKVEKALPMGLDRATIEGLSQWLFPPSTEPVRRLRFATSFLRLPPVWVPDWSAD